ncbi:FHA [Musa troglodytarum]|uniref:FHA n=1 Tax=Musa troglodytarum TaxID=320322 RepID=A0A9E7G1Y2_9LILI|nr:FHA [Musa troglodytarum]
MGALATLTKWIPEDDFLLKNAVEAGASLESLAKGAVCFSRRFTLRELQDRWYSLLYDSDTSAEASARMIEFEIEVSMSNPSKGISTSDQELQISDSEDDVPNFSDVEALVSLGRGTDDVEVDIDLREEGHANKISRRQINNHKNSSNEKFSNSHNL